MDSNKCVAIGSAVNTPNVEPNHCSVGDNNDNEWLIISKRDSTSRLLPRRMIFVGRQDCDICVASTTVDMRHAVLFFNGLHFHIKDLNSAYGTYVNDKRIAGQCYVRLQHSDRLRFGFGPDLFIIEKISSLPLTANIGCDSQLISGDIESIESCVKMETQKSDENKGTENLSKGTDPVLRLICENNSNSSLSNSIDSLDEIKSIKPIKDSKSGYSSDKKELKEINEEIIAKEETNTSFTPTPAPNTLESDDTNFGSPTAFIITLDDDNQNKKKMSISDSIRQFAPPKPDSIEKRRSPKTDKNETIKCSDNLFSNRNSPTNRLKRESNALNTNKIKTTNKCKTPTSSVANTSPENGGHLSDSATYLINRMLSNRKTDNRIQSLNMKSNTISSTTNKGSYGEKADSGLSDDIKSDSGNTYTVDDNNEELENARKKIDQVFGVDDSATLSLNSSPDCSLTLNSPTLLKNFDEKLLKIRQSFNSTKDQNDSEMKTNSQLLANNSTFTRTKRRAPTAEEMLHKIETKTIDNNTKKNLSNDLNRNKCNSSQSNQLSKNENKTNNYLKSGVSQSAPSTPQLNARSPLLSRKLIELRMNSKQTPKVLNVNLRKNSWNSDLDYYESYNSDESTDQSHQSSNSTVSKEGGNASSASVPSKINFNRAFALRRARLGIETPGIDLNVNTNNSRRVLNRNDGGRFSLRVKRDLNDNSRKITDRISSKEKINNNIVQRKGSDPLGSAISATNRSKPMISSFSDTERRNTLNSNRLNQLNNRLRNNSNLNNISNSSKFNAYCRQKSTDSEVSQRSGNKRIGSNSGNNLSENRPYHCRTDIGINSDGNMSSILSEPSHKPPVHNFQQKSVKSGLELTALDGLVVSAINQLSQKLRNNLTEIMESQRTKHEISSQSKNMIDEVLPQLAAPDKRLSDNSISVSRDLSSILKNLKKIDQSIEVMSHLLEPNTTKTSKSFRKQSNDFFVVDI